MPTRSPWIVVTLAVLAANPVSGQSRVDANVVYGMFSGLALLMDVHYPPAPTGPAPRAWNWLPPVPRHFLMDVPTAELRTHPFGVSQPIGNGPFRFVSREPG